MVGTTAKVFAVAAALGMVGVVLAWNPGGSLASAQGGNSNGAPHPADKIAIAGSGIGFLGPGNRVDPIFTASIKTSSPTDLIFNVHTECALWTEISVLGNGETSEATARVKVFVEFDGQIVPVASDDTEDPGKVVFCDRVYGMTFTSADDEDDKIDSYIKSRSANSFSWLTLNVGSGTHDIVVYAELETATQGQASAQAGYGKRTLVVEPVKLANDATI